MIERLYTTEEVAALTHRTPGAFAQLRYRGLGPRATPVGKRNLYAESDVAEWLKILRDGEDTAAARRPVTASGTLVRRSSVAPSDRKKAS